MTALELYHEASRLFPHAGQITANVLAQTSEISGLHEMWTVGVTSAPTGEHTFDTAYAYGYSGKECLEKLLLDGLAKEKERAGH